MTFNKLIFLLISIFLLNIGCLKYSFTGASIPPGVNSIYIPFFEDRSNSSQGDLTDRLNVSLVDRFVNQSSLQLANNEENADAILEGTITSYSNRPFSIGGDQVASENRVQITVQASFKYKSAAEPEWNKSFSGVFNFDPQDDPIAGEQNAATQALTQIANSMFTDAVSNW